MTKKYTFKYNGTKHTQYNKHSLTHINQLKHKYKHINNNKKNTSTHTDISKHKYLHTPSSLPHTQKHTKIRTTKRIFTHTVHIYKYTKKLSNQRIISTQLCKPTWMNKEVHADMPVKQKANVGKSISLSSSYKHSCRNNQTNKNASTNRHNKLTYNNIFIYIYIYI